MAKELSDRIRELIRKKGFTQADFAQKLGITQQQVSHLMSGKRAWTQKTWEAAADALGMSPAELFGESAAKGSDTVPVTLVFQKGDYRRLAEEARQQMVDVPSLIKFAISDFLRRNATKEK